MTTPPDTTGMIHRGFAAMGTDVNLWVDAGAGERAKAALIAADAFLHGFDRSLTRFSPDSELSRLNAAEAREVAVSPLLTRMVEAARGAAESSGGLVDPTLLTEIEEAGYTQTLYRAAPAPLVEALTAVHTHRPARPHPTAAWREIEVDAERSVVSRPPGMRIDSGGVGKGLAADMVAEMWHGTLPPGTGFVIDCGGDLHFGRAADGRAYDVAVDVPFLDGGNLSLSITGGGVATSGIGRRIWRRADGSYAHHLLDPARGEPAWTGVVSVTAIGHGALHAETIAKTALLSGPEGARELLAPLGGALVLAAGGVEIVEAGGDVHRLPGAPRAAAAEEPRRSAA